MTNKTNKDKRREVKLREFSRELGNFFVYNWMSLFIIGVYVMLILTQPQGKIVLYDLLTSPVNMFLFMVIIYCLGHVVSLYPVYFSKWRESPDEIEDTKWEMHHDVLGLGLIVYKYCGNSGGKYKVESTLRKLVGLLFYIGILYTIYKLAASFGYDFSKQLFIFLCIFLLVIFWFLNDLKDKKGHYVYHKTEIEKACGNREKKIYKHRHIDKIRDAAEVTFVLMVVSGIATILFASMHLWSENYNRENTLTALSLHIIFAAINFMIERVFRKQLQYANKGKWRLSAYYSFLAEDVNYLKITSFGGWLTLLLFVIAQFVPEQFNVAVIIFSFFYMLYGVIIIPMKHYFFYTRQDEVKKGIQQVWWFLSMYVYPVFWILFIVWNLYTSRVGNNLHLLESIAPKTHQTVSIDAYVDEFKAHFKDKEEIYFIASYGGGLRANIWTQLVLEDLFNGEERNILDNTAAMSVFSGGALGLGFYTALLKEGKSPVEKEEIIKTMASQNFVSLDLAWVFGADYVRELIPLNSIDGDDRAKRAMKLYHKVIDESAEMDEQTFEEYWGGFFKERRDSNGFYPAMFINSTSTNQKRGISSSVRFGNEFLEAFPGAIDVLNHGEKSLSYLHGISPAHRFPLASPGAKIEGKGIFLDGGYFENSGMLTSYDFYTYLEDRIEDEFWEGKKVIFIQIDNNPTSYARNRVAQLDSLPKREIKETGEIGNIQTALFSTSNISVYIEESLRNSNEYEYVTISLPYEVDTLIVKNKILKSKMLDDKILDLVKKSNDSLRMILGSEKDAKMVEPVLGRLITEGAYHYMKKVLAPTDSIPYHYVYKELDAQIKAGNQRKGVEIERD